MSPTHHAYFNDQVTGSNPVRLISILYEEALRNLANARSELRRGDVRGRGASVSKVSAVLIELCTSLNDQAGGDLSLNMREIYSFLHHQLIEANFEQSDEKFVTVEQILHTMADPWVSGEVERRIQVKAARPQSTEAAAGASRTWVL
jgi:flagellar protein FliS